MNIEELKRFCGENMAVIVYFTTKSCNVCKALRPKIEVMIKENFSEMKFLYIDAEEFPETAAQYSIFAVPSILCFFDGKESIRKSRHIGIDQLGGEISRIYNMIFD